MSLVEVTLSVAIVGGLLASVFTAVGVSAQRGFSTTQRSKAAWLARDLLAEIGSLPCTSGGDNILTNVPIDLGDVTEIFKSPEGSSRATFNSVYDYADWSSTPPVDSEGDALPGYEGWSRAATVVAVNPQTLDRRTGQDTAALITVVAIGPNGQRATASVLRTQAADRLRGIEGGDSAGVSGKVLDGVASMKAGK
jgi:type II secretory pathway pseudopilin PulG